MIRESRAVHICIVLALAMVAFDVSVYRLERYKTTAQAATPCDISRPLQSGETCYIPKITLIPEGPDCFRVNSFGAFACDDYIVDLPTQRIKLHDYPSCPWWIDAELWWREDCPQGKAPALPVPEELR